jgi:hypothetical protein
LSDVGVVVANSLRCLFILAATGVAAQIQRQTPGFPGDAPLLVHETETSKDNVVTIGLRVSSDLDDNALNSNQNQQGDLVALIQPRLEWHLSRARLDSAVDYTPGFSRSQSFSAYDSFSHLLDSGFQLKLTKRLRLRVHENFLRSTNPFDQLRASESAGGRAIGNIPNDVVPATPAEAQTEQASTDIVYATSAHSTVGIGGEFFSAKYSLLPGAQLPTQLLQDSRSAGTHGYYSRQVTRHQWTGFEYRVQKLIFNSGESWSLVQTLVYTHTVTPSHPMTFSFFAGPERSVTENAAGAVSALSPSLLGRRSMWHWSGGATGRWSGMRTSVSVRLSRKVGDDGVLGAVQLLKTSAELSRQFGRQWTARLLASYDDSKALTVPVTLSYAAAAAGLVHTLGPSLSLEFQYWRVHSASNGSLPAAFLADHDRISMSLIYDLKHPLGR